MYASLNRNKRALTLDFTSEIGRPVFEKLIAEGHATREIADMLCVSISTVKSHRAKIMEKLGIDTPVRLVHFALQLGLVDPDLKARP